MNRRLLLFGAYCLTGFCLAVYNCFSLSFYDGMMTFFSWFIFLPLLLLFAYAYFWGIYQLIRGFISFLTPRNKPKVKTISKEDAKKAQRDEANLNHLLGMEYDKKRMTHEEFEHKYNREDPTGTVYHDWDD